MVINRVINIDLQGPAYIPSTSELESGPRSLENAMNLLLD